MPFDKGCGTTVPLPAWVHRSDMASHIPQRKTGTLIGLNSKFQICLASFFLSFSG